MAAGFDRDSNLEGQFQFRERWQDALKYCAGELGSDDFALIEGYDGPEKMIAAIESFQTTAANDSIPRLLRSFKPRLLQLRGFAMGIAVGIGMESMSMAVIWGVMTLMLELAIQSDAMLEEITSMWAEISTSLQVFESYQPMIEKDILLQEAQFEILVELLLFAALTINTVKSTRVGSRVIATLANWSLLRAKFRETSEKIANRILRVKERAEAEYLRLRMEETKEHMKHFQLPQEDDLKTLNDSSNIDPAKLPCYYVPFPANPNFYGRTEILHEIESKIGNNKQADMIQSTALWATSGMGKTQVALAYAELRRSSGTNAIFWIRSEDESEAFRSFTEIASLLNLPGATSSVGHEQNKLIVLQWLQQTKTPWLIIYDNLESQKLLNRMIPSCGRGSTLVTCRSDLLAASAARSSIELPSFSLEAGRNLLLKELSLLQPTDNEKEAAEKIAKRLGGHALAIDVIARHMLSRKKNLMKFIDEFEADKAPWKKKNKRGIASAYYEHDLDYAWKAAFKVLEAETAQIYGIACMVAPEKLPIEILSKLVNGNGIIGVTATELEEIILDLKDLALIRTDEEQISMSVHRLLQAEFRNHISDDDLRLRWREASMVLHEAFPQQKQGFMLHNHWKTCESLIEHVQVLCQRLPELLAAGGHLAYSEDFVYLASDASRYLFEIGRYNAALEIVYAGFLHCNDKQSVEYSNLCVQLESCLCERGQDKDALPYCQEVLDIRKAKMHPHHLEIANALSNYALSITGTGHDLEKAEAMLKEAHEIDMQGSIEHAKKVLHLRYYNLSFTYCAMGRVREAKEECDKATKFVIEEFGPASRYLNITYRLLADFATDVGDYDEAYQNLEKSHAIAMGPNSTNPWVSASLYKMAGVRLKQGRAREAVDLLRKAEFVTNLNEREKGDKGDTARVLNRLAIALKAAGDVDESERVRAKADGIYEGLMTKGLYTRSDDHDLKWEYLVCLKFR